MRNLLLSSCLLLLFACARSNYHKQEVIASMSFMESGLPLLFKNYSPSPLYKANVRLYGKEFGGLLLVKNMPDSSYRIIFTTETGIKLFDYQLSADSFVVHFCIDKFNHDAVLNTIAADIRLLLTEFKQNEQAKKILTKNGTTAFIFEAKEISTVYEINSDQKSIARIISLNGKRKKVEIDCTGMLANVPKKMHIRHHDIRLTIDLNLLER